MLLICIKVKKPSCVCVGPRHNVTCVKITSDGDNLPWVNEIRYLGIFIACHVSFRSLHAVQNTCGECTFCQGWSLWLRGGDTGVGLEVCALPKRVLQSLDFTVK